jgi:predicted permease
MLVCCAARRIINLWREHCIFDFFSSDFECFLPFLFILLFLTCAFFVYVSIDLVYCAKSLQSQMKKMICHVNLFETSTNSSWEKMVLLPLGVVIVGKLTEIWAVS